MTRWPQYGRLKQTKECLAILNKKPELNADDVGLLSLAAGWGVYEIERLREVVVKLRNQLRPNPDRDGPCCAFNDKWYALYDAETARLCGESDIDPIPRAC
jgi:hypothetical protein